MASTKHLSCNNISNGHCKFGRKCKYSHDPTTVCLPFLSRKGCLKADDCYFAHPDQSATDSNQPSHRTRKTRVPPSEVDPDYEARFRKWIFLIPRNNRQVPDISLFFKTGYQLLAASDARGQQRLIKKLAAEEGLNMIKTLVEAVDDEHHDECHLLFEGAVIPLFQILTYPNVASSLVLEHPLDTVYNFLYGPGGRRGVIIFRFTSKALLHAVVAGDSDTNRNSALGPCVAALERLVDLNQGAQLQQEFLSVVESVSACVEPSNMSPESRRRLDKIRLRVGLGSLMPSAAKAKPVATGKATFTLSTDLPGELSSKGPRHDNDHEDIDDIQILPTAQEINSTRLEYLPLNNANNNHLAGLPALLDRQFRLLREDAIGGLRDAVRREIAHLTNASLPTGQSGSSNAERTHVHENLTLQRWEVDRRKGIQLVVHFEQPRHITQSGELARKEWWESSRRLQPTSLVCIVASSGQIIFCLVCNPEPTAPIKRRQQPRDEEAAQAAAAEEEAAEAEYQRRKMEMPTLHKQSHRAAVMLTIVETNCEHVAWISRHLVSGRRGRNAKMSLVEFPGVLLPSFEPTLKALQSMSRSLDLPFTDYLAPEAPGLGTLDVAPPLYAQKQRFAFNLSPIANGKTLELSPTKPFDRALFRDNTTLDEAQQSAVLQALTNSLALIQGPPGTGKSYTGVSIIKTLLYNREPGDIGPIICVCYTNHALDQLLEHLVIDGIRQVVRIGSRSKSELLKDINLRDLAQEIQLTRDEGQEKYQLYQQLNSAIDEMEDLLNALNALGSEESLKAYLTESWPRYYEQLFGADKEEDGFTLVRHNYKDLVGSWLRGAERNDRDLPESALQEMSLDKMSASERQRLHSRWIKDHAKQLALELESALESYTETRDELDKYYQEQQRRALCEAYIVGVTTSGLAKNLAVLRHLRSKVMVCEEAGEVMEAHTLTALLPSVEHAILIGDHQQLRPQVKNYNLCHDNPRGKHLALDISLFERLVEPAHGTKLPPMPFSRLKTQRRMHPSIAELIRRTLYVDLEDHATVSDYPAVLGMKDRLFWLNHDNREDGADPTKAHSDSKSNSFEVSMVSALASHLVRQGIYAAEDIAILTPYVRQLQNLRRALSGMFEVVMNDRDVDALEEQEPLKGARPAPLPSSIRKTTLANALRIATVDNFQGEEAKIIILSFVRCNVEGKCGFLRTSNRINVALSRAQHGMYIIGDAQTASSVPMWAEIVGILDAQGNIGDRLTLCCPRHPDDLIEVTTPDDFAVFSPEGGCNKRCTSRLQCGHACPNKCHSETLHKAVHCLERCLRSKPGCDHTCSKSCGDPCDVKCKVEVADFQLPCGHICNLPCHQTQEPEKVKCRIKQPYTMPGCGHEILIRCCDDPTNDKIKCSAPCGASLPCGHDCIKPCTTCRVREKGRVTSTQHGECTSPCGRPFTTCNHSCKATCHGEKPCPLCSEPCQVQCVHSQCNRRCHEPCVPCAEKCTSSCPHGHCEMPCAVPCDRLPCSLRCSQRLSCGHQCPSACGEPCPDIKFCQICGDEAIKSSMVDYYEALTYEEIDLDEDPCMFPSCGHVITRTNLDQHMEMKEYYQFGFDGVGREVIIAAKVTSAPMSVTVQKTCPACRAPIRNINRYSRIARRAWIDEATKKFIVWANSNFVPMAARMAEMEAQFQPDVASAGDRELQKRLKVHIVAPLSLEGSSESQIRKIYSLTKSDTRYKDAFRLRTRITDFLSRVNESEQPFTRIYDLVQDAKRHRGVEGSMTWTPDVLQTRNRLLATVLLIRCEYTILANFLKMSKGTAAQINIDFKDHQNRCKGLLEDATARNQPAIEVEGHLFWARFLCLERGVADAVPDGSSALVTAREHLQTAREICTEYQGQTAGMLSEIEDVEKALRDSTFYTSITNEEKAAIYAAMASDFRGTGHWYYCANGHPFTVGECGMPMQTSRCPQCGATVGGERHTAVEGVRRAADMDEQFGRLVV